MRVTHWFRRRRNPRRLAAALRAKTERARRVSAAADAMLARPGGRKENH